MKKKLLTQRQFKRIYAKVPRTCVELIIFKGKRVLLSRRSIEPFNSYWHFPGVSILYRETVNEAIKRVAKKELGVSVSPQKFLGYIEYMKDGYRHSVSLAFKCKITGKKEPRAASQASEIGFFDKAPKKTIKEQKEFLKRFHKE